MQAKKEFCMSYTRKTKIIATMGPGCADKKILRDMVNAGMNARASI